MLAFIKFKSWFFIIAATMVVLINMPGVAQAQKKGYLNLAFSGEYDDSRGVYVGFTIPSVSIPRYVIKKSADWNTLPTNNEGDNFSSISGGSGWESGIGVPVRFRINHYWSISSGINLPNLFFHDLFEYDNQPEQGLRVTYYRDTTAVNKMTSNVSGGETHFRKIEIPFHFQLRSDKKFIESSRSQDPLIYRMYLLAGGSYGWHIGSIDKYTNYENIPIDNPSLIVKPSYLNIEVGLGLDLYFRYFKLSPEIRFSHSAGNILDMRRNGQIQREHPDSYHNPYMDAISRLSLRSFQFSLIFE